MATGKRILVIDDEEAVRDAFELALEGSDWEVTTAEDGEGGVVEAQRQRPDLIFLDLRLPGIDGVETLRRLRELYTQVPVYVVTAFRREFLEPLRQASQDGLAFELADKPLNADQIRAVVDGVLRD